MRIQIKSVILLLALSIGLSSLHAQGKKADPYKSYKKTAAGLPYKIFSNGKGAKIHTGDLVTVNYILMVERPHSKDSVLANTLSMGGPERLLLKETDKNDDIVSRTMKEVIGGMATGDSAIFVVPIDSIEKNIREKVPALQQGGKLKWNISVADVMSGADYQKKQMDAKTQIINYIDSLKIQYADQAKKDSVVISDYIKKNKLDAKALPSGLYYVIEQQGTGEEPLPYEQVTVNYKGYLTDGTVFDNSFDRGEPIVVPVGAGRVIPGWEEGLMLFKKGAKGKLLVPSYLAYGDKANASIPANSVLIFDIDMLDIK